MLLLHTIKKNGKYYHLVCDCNEKQLSEILPKFNFLATISFLSALNLYCSAPLINKKLSLLSSVAS